MSTTEKLHPPAGIVAARAIEALLSAGLPPDAVTLPAVNQLYSSRIARFWRIQKTGAFVSQEHAREIMGDSCIPLSEARRAFDVKTDDSVSCDLGLVPFAAASLHECSATHLLFPVFTVSASSYAEAAKQAGILIGEGYTLDMFLPKARTARWHLLRKEPVRSLGSDSPDGLCPSSGETVPSLSTVVYGALLHRLLNNQRLLGSLYAACRLDDRAGVWAIVGMFNDDGFHVGSHPSAWFKDCRIASEALEPGARSG